MRTTKVLTGLAIMMCALAASTAPASAFFESTTSSSSGPVFKFPAKTTFNLTVGEVSATTVCESTATTKATGFWTIQTSEETVTGEEQKQPPTKVGPHQAVTIQKWGTCKATLGGTTLAAEVTECRIQAAQPVKGTGEQETLGSIQTACVIKIPAAGCTITWPQLTLNHLIAGIRQLAGAVGRIILRWLMRHLTEKASAACVGVSGEHKEGSIITGTEGNEGIELEGQKLI